MPGGDKRAAIAVAVGLLIVIAPLPRWTARWFAYFHVPVVVFLLVCYLGKLLPVLVRV